MPTNRTAIEALGRDFLDVRHRLLDIAASLDRMDRSTNAGLVRSDPRYKQIEEAVRVLTEGQADRAGRVQMVFSLPHNEHWKSALGVEVNI